MSVSTAECHVCRLPPKSVSGWGGGPGLLVDCPRCGVYRLYGAFEIDNRDRRLISGVLRRQSDALNGRSDISDDEKWHSRIVRHDLIRALVASAPQTVDETLVQFLDAIRRETEMHGLFVSGYIKLDPDNDASLAYCADADDLRYMAHALEGIGWANLPAVTRGSIGIQITPKGWQRLDELRRANIDSANGFVAMWFDGSVREACDKGIFVGIGRAGYRPVRVDNEEFNDGIFDKIVASIRQSRFVVGDLTGERPNAYLEIGYAMGMGLPVILTCRKGDKTHFDLAHRNTIFWTDPADLATRIENRIIATIGRGPNATDGS